jgi:hypothetical protein
MPAHERWRLTLSHPDYTVGPGISPSPEVLRDLLSLPENRCEKAIETL